MIRPHRVRLTSNGSAEHHLSGPAFVPNGPWCVRLLRPNQQEHGQARDVPDDGDPVVRPQQGRLVPGHRRVRACGEPLATIQILGSAPRQAAGCWHGTGYRPSACAPVSAMNSWRGTGVPPAGPGPGSTGGRSRSSATAVLVSLALEDDAVAWPRRTGDDLCRLRVAQIGTALSDRVGGPVVRAGRPDHLLVARAEDGRRRLGRPRRSSGRACSARSRPGWPRRRR